MLKLLYEEVENACAIPANKKIEYLLGQLFSELQEIIELYAPDIMPRGITLTSIPGEGTVLELLEQAKPIKKLIRESSRCVVDRNTLSLQ